FVRIVNVPPRSMGDKSIAEVELIAQRKGLSCWAAAEKLCAGQLSGNDTRSTNKLRKVLPPFIKVIKAIRDLANTGCTVPDLIRRIIELVHYEEYLHKNHSDSESRWENVQELINFAEEIADPEAEYAPPPIKSTHKTEMVLNDDGSFSEVIEEEDSPMNSETPLRTFLQTSSLSTDTETAEDEGEEDKARVTVSTCHAAKGLEWPVVFIPSTEKGTFPFYRTDSVTEERRLLYVACTRAQAFLYLSHAENRMVGVLTTFSAPAVSVIPGSSKPISVGSTSNAAPGKPVQASVAAYFKPKSTQKMQTPLSSAMSTKSNQNQSRAITSVAPSTARPTASRDIIDLTKDSIPPLTSVVVTVPRTAPSKENLPAARPKAPIQLAGGKRRLGMGHIPDGFNTQPSKKLRGP
ncbi:hypothetical protein FRC01_009998, partial [Tulasnella sp. 417]